MATIAPVAAVVGDVVTVTWTGVSTADTMTPYGPIYGQGAKRASVTFTGTFGGATLTLAGSNDNATFVGLTDLAGNAISATAAEANEFSTSVLYLNPTSSGGAGDNVTVIVAMRGD